MGYPERSDEIRVIDSQELSDPLDALTAVVNGDEIKALVRRVRSLHASETVKNYIVDLARATRETPAIKSGVSTRAGIQLLRAAKGAAALAGRSFVLPDDVQAMVPNVWGHRLRMGRTDSADAAHDALDEILRRVKVA
jgi:MoxR-like ATPase